MEEEMVRKYIKREYRRRAFKVMAVLYGIILVVAAVLYLAGEMRNSMVINKVTELILFASIVCIIITSKFQAEGVESTFVSFRVSRKISLDARKGNVLIHAAICSMFITSGDMIGKSIIWSERNMNDSYILAFFVLTFLFYMLFIATVVFCVDALSSKVVMLLMVPYIAVSWGCIASAKYTNFIIIDSVTYTPVLCVIMLLLCVLSFYFLQYRMMRRDYKMWGGNYE